MWTTDIVSASKTIVNETSLTYQGKVKSEISFLSPFLKRLNEIVKSLRVSGYHFWSCMLGIWIETQSFM